MQDVTALLIGFLLVLLLGVGHYFGLSLVRALKPSAERRQTAAIIITFAGLLALHTVEILAFAAAYKVLLVWGAIGGLTGSFDQNWSGLIYFSGINFVTLGYTQIETAGSIRLVSMMQSLGGFMVLTWSATFLYSVCENVWKR